MNNTSETKGGLATGRNAQSAETKLSELRRRLSEFSTLHAWLAEHLYQHGRKFKPNELVERTIGGKMSVGPYLAYLRAKYGELYQLPPLEKS